MKRKQRPVQYGKLLQDIKARILTAQHAALKAVNKELVALYWDIGKMIVERQKGDGWGKAVVVKLAEDLQKEFSENRGLSTDKNFWKHSLNDWPLSSGKGSMPAIYGTCGNFIKPIQF